MTKKQLNKNEELLLNILFDVYLQTICQINGRLFIADLEQIHRFIKLQEMKNNKNLFDTFIKENNYLVLFEEEYSKYQKLVKSEIECEFY